MRIPTKALQLVFDEIESAEKMHPRWPTDQFHQFAILQEEVGEVAKALHERECDRDTDSCLVQATSETTHNNRVTSELVQVVAMGLRMLVNHMERDEAHRAKKADTGKQ